MMAANERVRQWTERCLSLGRRMMSVEGEVVTGAGRGLTAKEKYRNERERKKRKMEKV